MATRQLGRRLGRVGAAVAARQKASRRYDLSVFTDEELDVLGELAKKAAAAPQGRRTPDLFDPEERAALERLDAVYRERTRARAGPVRSAHATSERDAPGGTPPARQNRFR